MLHARIGLRGCSQHAVRGLTPGYLALVMGSGIISVGMLLDGYRTLSALLLAVAAVSFVVLIALTCWRLLAYREAVADDFTDPRRGFGFCTLIAGTNVLGVRVAMDGHHEITAILLAGARATTGAERPERLERWLRGKQPDLVSDIGWQAIDAVERRAGQQQRRPRVKLVRTQGLLDAVRGHDDSGSGPDSTPR